jgi:hypothetical protein
MHAVATRLRSLRGCGGCAVAGMARSYTDVAEFAGPGHARDLEFVGAGHARDLPPADQNEKPRPITGPLIVMSSESLPFSKS